MSFEDMDCDAFTGVITRYGFQWRVSMSLSNYYQINLSSVVYEMFDTEVVIINLDNGNYFSFEGVGPEIWKLINKYFTVGEIIDWIRVRYDLNSVDDIVQVVTQCIAELKKENLIIDGDPEKENNIQQTVDQEDTPDPNIFNPPLLTKYTDMNDFLLVDPIHEIDYEKFPDSKDS